MLNLNKNIVDLFQWLSTGLTKEERRHARYFDVHYEDFSRIYKKFNPKEAILVENTERDVRPVSERSRLAKPSKEFKNRWNLSREERRELRNKLMEEKTNG